MTVHLKPESLARYCHCHGVAAWNHDYYVTASFESESSGLGVSIMIAGAVTVFNFKFKLKEQTVLGFGRRPRLPGRTASESR